MVRFKPGNYTTRPTKREEKPLADGSMTTKGVPQKKETVRITLRARPGMQPQEPEDTPIPPGNTPKNYEESPAQPIIGIQPNTKITLQ